MKNLLLLYVAWLLCSCGSHEISSTDESPFSKSFVADQVEPADENDLRDLLSTLPVFDLSPSERRAVLEESAELRPGEVRLAADGAQTAVGLRKLAGVGDYELRDGWPGAIGTHLYRLRRMNGGWRVLSRETLASGITMAGEGPA